MLAKMIANQVPNYSDTDIFKPIYHQLVRQILTGVAIPFDAIPSASDTRGGLHLFRPAATGCT